MHVPSAAMENQRRKRRVRPAATHRPRSEQLGLCLLLTRWRVELTEGATHRAGPVIGRVAGGGHRWCFGGLTEVTQETRHAGKPAPLYVDWGRAASLDEQVTIAGSKVTRIGDLWDEGETKLQKKYGKEIVRRLKLELVKAEYSPKGTGDRLDFLARDPVTDEFVVVEIKVACGQKRAVEQVERYIDFIRKEKDTEKVRGVLITGLGDESTRAALNTLSRPELVAWYLYGFEGEKLRLQMQKQR